MPEVDPEAITPATMVAAGIQLVLLLAGLAAIAKFNASRKARLAAGLPPAVGGWILPASDFLVAAFAVFLGGLGLQFTVGMLGHATPIPSADPALWLILQGVAFQLGMLAGALIGASYIRTKGSELQGGPAPEGSVMIMGAVTFLAALPLVTGVSLAWNAILGAFGIEAPRQELVDLFASGESRPAAILMAGFAVVVAPITEELIFRAGLFRYLRTRTPRWLALLLPSVIFGSLHGNLAAFVPLAALGIIFSLAYEHTGKIAVSMVAHGLFNLNTIVLLLAGVTV